MEQLQNNLAVIMAKRLISINDVCEGTGLHRSTISHIYNRKSPCVTLKTLKTLCDYLEVPLSELVEYDPKLKGGETDEDTTTD